ncbi:MAG: hypothetical protein NUV91_06500 [Candidatus Omnitrophica bacterium]|nr:hypothetical protein [Candidatus Omnitrophota bacterium]
MIPKNKKRFFVWGLSLVILSVTMGGVFVYSLLDAQRLQLSEVHALQAQLDVSQRQKNSLVSRMEELERTLDASISLDRGLVKARQNYNQKENSRDGNGGYLWVDRQSQTLLITLGSLNGVMPGSRLVIYDQQKKPVGSVKAETSLDAISYVSLLDVPLNQLKEDYYWVEPEEN